MIELPEGGDTVFRLEGWKLRNCTRDGMASIRYELQSVHCSVWL